MNRDVPQIGLPVMGGEYTDEYNGELMILLTHVLT